MSNVDIKIAAEFVGKKEFKKAETATQKLTKDVKKLAGAFGLAFGTRQLVSFGIKSVKAFADSELEAKRLTTAVTNLGLAFAAPEIDRYIDNVELATGVNRDLLQPSLLTLLQTTGSLTKSQELLNLSLDVAAGTGADVASVSQKLAQAYIGNAKGLRTLNLGLTTAELNSADFETIQKRITVLFGGQGAAAAESYVGQINKLSIASEQASEIIGKGLVDSLVILSNNNTVEDLAADMLDAARNTAAFTESVAGLANAILAPIKGLADVLAAFIKVTDPFADLLIAGDPSGFMKKAAPLASSAPVAGFNGKTFYADAAKNAEALAKAETTAKKRAAELLAIKKKQQALEAKALKDKKLAAAIDKANLELNKSSDVFDLDKIQIAAALTSQAEQLGKATSSAQVLQIANDTARLNVKRSILALEDAIAAKDEQAIIAATAKLNADLKVLGALGMQDVKLRDIKSILESLQPKDLINIANLEQALALLAKINLASTGSTKAAATTIAGSTSATAAATAAAAVALAKPTLTNTPFAAGGMFNLEDVARSSLLQGLSGGAGVAGAVSGSRYAAQAANQYNISIQASTIASPDELVNLVQDSLIQINRRGGSLTQAGAL
jgi:hypothetical protein